MYEAGKAELADRIGNSYCAGAAAANKSLEDSERERGEWISHNDVCSDSELLEAYEQGVRAAAVNETEANAIIESTRKMAHTYEKNTRGEK